MAKLPAKERAAVFAAADSVHRVEMRVDDLMKICLSIGVISSKAIPDQYVVRPEEVERGPPLRGAKILLVVVCVLVVLSFLGGRFRRWRYRRQRETRFSLHRSGFGRMAILTTLLFPLRVI